MLRDEIEVFVPETQPMNQGRPQSRQDFTSEALRSSINELTGFLTSKNKEIYELKSENKTLNEQLHKMDCSADKAKVIFRLFVFFIYFPFLEPKSGTNEVCFRRGEQECACLGSFFG